MPKSIHQNHNSISKIENFPVSQGAHTPSDIPAVCARAQLVLKRHQIIPPCPRRIFAPVHNILLVCLDYLPPPQYLQPWYTPLYNAHVCKVER